MTPFPDYHDDISGSENEAAEEYSDSTKVERHVVISEYISEQPCKCDAYDKITQFEIVIVLYLLNKKFYFLGFFFLKMQILLYK